MRYRTPAAFRQALEQHQQRRAAARGTPFARLAQIDLYFRFLERVLHELGDTSVVLKGGVALELRLGRARTTLDIDLRATGVPAETYERIRAAGLRDRGDYLTFQVEESVGEIEGDGVIDEGRRFRVEAMLASRPYRDPFGLDVAFGGPMVGAADRVAAPDALSFMGIAPPRT